MEEFNYFPSQVFREEKPEWVGSLTEVSDKAIAELKEQGFSGPVLQSHDIRHYVPWLCMHLGKTGKSILERQGYTTGGYEIIVTEMWAQEFIKHGMNILHAHGNTQLTGFLFLDTPENGSYPMFGDPRPGNEMSCLRPVQSQEILHSTPYIHFNNVMPGTILMFNSFLPHMITMSNTDKKTKFLHFMITAKR
jgi:hypothetical protein